MEVVFPLSFNMWKDAFIQHDLDALFSVSGLDYSMQFFKYNTETDLQC